MSKTAVNWLDEQIKKHTWYDEEGFGYVKVSSLDIEQAKEIEKEQIIKAFGYEVIDGEQYYNETYGK
jgi:hypothetical protein